MTTVQLEQTYSQLALPPEQIQLDPNQPRVVSSEEDFADLVASIAEQGILQPIQVEALPDGQYRIIVGSRRLAAALQLGLPSVPCLVRTTPLSSYSRLLSQLAENRVRADTDPYDEAIALKTVKVLADVEAASLQLDKVAGVNVPPPPPSPQSESNQERLARYEAYLEQLTVLMVSPEIAPQLAREIVYQDKVSGTYRLTNQALASWPQIEKACALTKGKRLSLVRLTQVKPEVVSLVRECGLQSHTNGAFRQRLSALAGIAPAYQQGVVECLVTQGQPLEPITLALLAEALEQLELDGMTETIDLPRLVTLLLSTPGVSATDLSQLYLKSVSSPEPELPLVKQTEDELDELMSMLSDEPTQTKPVSNPSRYSLESDFEERSGDGSGKPGGKGKGRGTGSQEREFEDNDEDGDEGGYGGGGGLPSDLDATAGFSLEGLEAELPPELAAEMEAMGLSETAQRSIATLDPADRPKVVEMLRQHPELIGKLRSIVKLVRDEGYSVEAACRECEGMKGPEESEETNLDEMGLLGIQKLVEATTLLNEALDTLRECAPYKQLTQLAEPFATRLQEHALMLRQLLLEAGFEF